MARRIFVRFSILVAVLVCGAAPAAAAEQNPTGGANHVVLATTSTDGANVVHTGLQVVPAPGDTVTSTNLALATATGCTGCHATAVAVQVLLVTRDPSYYAPANVAVAANAGCTSCGTFAYAWQYTLQTDGPAHLSPEGRQQVNQLRQEIDETAASIEVATPQDAEQLNTELDALTAELKAVVNANVVGSGPQLASRTSERFRLAT